MCLQKWNGPFPSSSLSLARTRRDFFLSLLIQQQELLEALGLEQAAPPSVTLPTAPILLAFSSSVGCASFSFLFSFPLALIRDCCLLRTPPTYTHRHTHSHIHAESTLACRGDELMDGGSKVFLVLPSWEDGEAFVTPVPDKLENVS